MEKPENFSFLTQILFEISQKTMYWGRGGFGIGLIGTRDGHGFDPLINIFFKSYLKI